jgi:ABC-type Fe3+ transport system permease subunit
MWWLLLLPIIMPPLVVGYAYSNVALSLIRHPVLNDLLYSLLLVMRFFPAALLMLHLAPTPPLSPSAMHNLKLAGQRRWRCYLTHGQGRLLIVAFAVVFIFCFTEFEITSRMGCISWTIWLFDAQVGGAPLASTLTWLILPVTVSLLVLAAVFMTMPQHRESLKDIAIPMSERITLRAMLLIGWWLLCMAVCVIIPWWSVLSPALGALPAVIAQMQIITEIGYSLLFALLATGSVMLVTIISHRMPRWLRWLCCLPGLCGSLVVGLVLLAIFQTHTFNSLYDTPLPIVLALAIIALPAALILRPILSRHNSSTHITWLTSLSLKKQHQTLARHLRWQQHHRGQLLLVGILFYITYHELPASALLAPSGMSPAVVRLYNLMHYGQYETLSAMVLLTYGVPAVMVALLVLAARGRKLRLDA